MPINNEDQKKLDHFWETQDARVSPTCPACGKQNVWEFGEIIACAVLTGQSAQTDGPTIQMVQQVCRWCRHIRLFEAAPAGIAR